MNVHDNEANPRYAGKIDWWPPMHGEHFQRCNFCGSIKPEDLAAEKNWKAEWADWKYGWPHKFYVDIPNRNPDELFAIGSTTGGPVDRPIGPGYIAWGDLTDEQRAIYVRDHHEITNDWPAPRGVMFGKRPFHHAKFYTIHLKDPDISQKVRGIIERKCGLSFEFKDGKVQWRPFHYDE